MSVAGQTVVSSERRRWRRFAMHLGEMVLVMLLGMLILGGAIQAGVAVAGASLSDASGPVRAAVMAATMTVPMVWWMLQRGHGAARSAEMAGAMLVPTALAIALYEAAVLPTGEALLGVQHAVMIPAMVGVMVWRLDHYAR